MEKDVKIQWSMECFMAMRHGYGFNLYDRWKEQIVYFNPDTEKQNGILSGLIHGPIEEADFLSNIECYTRKRRIFQYSLN